MSILDVSLPESTETQISHHSVVQDFGWWISTIDVVLQVRHKHQIPSLEPVIMQSVVVNMYQNSSGTDTISFIIGVNVVAEFLHLID